MDKTAPQIGLEEFWKEIELRTEIKIKDMDRLGDLLADFIMRCNQFVAEARTSAKNWRNKYEDLKQVKTKLTKTEKYLKNKIL